MRESAAFAQQGAALVATYTYNGHGQRVAKTANGQTTVFHYDQSGQLIAETNPSGTLKREYYYLNGQLFMLFDRATHTQYRLHPDHLGTVRLVTRSILTPVWRWDSAPFGETLPDENPDGDGQPFVFNLRFPGQYFDQETGLHYNYFRDYDPGTGRYIQSDPVGIYGGVNTYNYVEENPVRYIDQYGLQSEVALPSCLLGGPANPICDAAVIATTCKWLFIVGGAIILTQNNGQCDDGSCEAASDEGNTNPYEGPVDQPVVVVDQNGNAIPVSQGRQINASPNGDYQQVIGVDGRPTGDRMDRGGHRGQKDPRAQGPHGHRPGVTTPDGNPHLPIK